MRRGPRSIVVRGSLPPPLLSSPFSPLRSIRPRLIYDSQVTGTIKTVTYRELLDDVVSPFFFSRRTYRAALGK